MLQDWEVAENATVMRLAITVLELTPGDKAKKLLIELANRGHEDPIGRLAHAALWGKSKPRK